MKKVTTLVLMLCFILSGAFCYTNGVARTELVQNAQQLNQIDSMKRSITFSNTSGITLPSTTDKILRASDYFLINGPFEIATGAQLTLMVHECPDYTNNYSAMFNP